MEPDNSETLDNSTVNIVAVESNNSNDDNNVVRDTETTGTDVNSKLVNPLTLKKCPYCRHFITETHLGRHIKSLHSNRIVKNSHHKGKYKKKSDFKKQQKLFACPEPCGHTFDRKENLIRHKKRKTCVFNQTDECPFCKRCFMGQLPLWNHLNKRRCPKQFKCQICLSYFYIETKLSYHMEHCR